MRKILTPAIAAVSFAASMVVTVPARADITIIAPPPPLPGFSDRVTDPTVLGPLALGRTVISGIGGWTRNECETPVFGQPCGGGGLGTDGSLARITNTDAFTFSVPAGLILASVTLSIDNIEPLIFGDRVGLGATYSLNGVGGTFASDGIVRTSGPIRFDPAVVGNSALFTISTLTRRSAITERIDVSAYDYRLELETRPLIEPINGVTPIRPPLPAVPEPATWAMMILGFGVIGGAMRRRGYSASASIKRRSANQSRRALAAQPLQPLLPTDEQLSGRDRRATLS